MEEVGEIAVGKAAKANDDDLTCELCDKSFKNTRALMTHKGRSHKANTGSPISQLDGHGENFEVTEKAKKDNEDIESSEEETSCCWNTSRLKYKISYGALRSRNCYFIGTRSVLIAKAINLKINSFLVGKQAFHFSKNLYFHFIQTKFSHLHQYSARLP